MAQTEVWPVLGVGGHQQSEVSTCSHHQAGPGLFCERAKEGIYFSVITFYQGSSQATAQHCGLALMTWTPVEVGSGQTTHPSSTSTGRAVRHGDTPLPSPCLASAYPALEVGSRLFNIPSWNVPSALV